MRHARLFAVLALAAMSVTSASIALQPTDDPTTAPTTSPSRGVRQRPIRLTVPWNKVADLTDEQKAQINAIHVDTIAQIKALEAAEDEKCMALLTEDQRKALEETLEQEKVARKAKAGKKE